MWKETNLFRAFRRPVVWAVLLLCSPWGTPEARAQADAPRLRLTHRWVYVSTNLLVDKNVESTLSLLERAKKAGYNGIALADSKFMRWDRLPDRYHRNARRVRDACRKLELKLVACVMPIGYSNSLLSRDVNLAAGLPADRKGPQA